MTDTGSGWGVIVRVRDMDRWDNQDAVNGTVFHWERKDWTDPQVRISELIQYAHTRVDRPDEYSLQYDTAVYYQINLKPTHDDPRTYRYGAEIVGNPRLDQLVYEFQREDYDVFNGFTCLIIERFV